MLARQFSRLGSPRKPVARSAEGGRCPQVVPLRRAASRGSAVLVRLLILVLALPPCGARLTAADETDRTRDAEVQYETLQLRGRVGWLSDALARRFDVRQVPEAAERVLVLETPDGQLHPLVEDTRGRAFRRDPRLRQIDVEITARRHHGSPFVQVIRVLEIAKDGKYELDYWCEICAIAMYELKECDCCQGPIDLRRRKVER